MSDLDFEELVQTAEGRLVVEVLQARRLPLLMAMQDSGEVTFWYPPTVLDNLRADSERMMEWIRLLEEHVEQLMADVPKQ